MSYTVNTDAGGTTAISRNDRITNINGNACEYYVSDVFAAQAASRFPFMRTWPIKIRSTTLTGGVVVPGTEYTIQGQVRYRKANALDPDRDPNAPKTQGHFLVLSADQDGNAQLVKVEFADKRDAQKYTNAFAVALINVTETGGDPFSGTPGTIAETSVAISYLEVDLDLQSQSAIDSSMLTGDAKLLVSKESVTLAQLTGARYIQITPSGGSAVRYTTDNRRIVDNGRHQFEVYLQRIK